MPPPPKGASNQTKSKKKKGPAPAHQNKFAFRHNPKSKTTEKILSSPNIHVCRRCHDKIEWRKQYRKYKPRTQPGICNECKRRNVLSAYHTICTQCTTDSEAAKKVIAMETESTNLSTSNEEATAINTGSGDSPVERPTGNDVCRTTLRACAVCVKVLAMPDPERDKIDELDDAMACIRLRERKTIERKLAKEMNSTKGSGNGNNDESEDTDDDGAAVGQRIDGDDLVVDFSDTDSYDDEDPFLKAIGGADQLLIGEAYQQRLLQLQHQQQQQEKE